MVRINSYIIVILQEFYLPMQSGGILSPENLAAIFLNLQVNTESDVGNPELGKCYVRSLSL